MNRDTAWDSPAILSEEERRRVERGKELHARGSAGVSPLLEMLGDRSWAVRRQVIAALASMGRPAVEGLCELLRHDRDDETRIAAAVDALSAAEGEVEPAIVELSHADEPAVVADAAQILGRRRTRSGLGRLVELCKHDDDNVAVAALEALGRIGGRAAVESLVEAVRSRSFFRTFPAIDVLGRTGDPRAVEPLVELLGDSVYALEAARALGRTGDRNAVGPLAGLLGKPADVTVRVAALALAELSSRHQERFGEAGSVEESLRDAAPPAAGRSLTRALGEGRPQEKEAIAWVLGALGRQDAVPTLAGLLRDVPTVARAAAAALEHIGRTAAREVEVALQEGDSERRRILLPTLVARLHSTEGVLACLDDPDPVVRASACDVLARMANPRVVPALFDRLGDPDPRVLQSATAAIQSLGSADTERLALEAARSTDARLRRAAFRIIAYFGYGSALDLFLEAIEGDDPRLRESAIQGLPFIEDPRAMETLLELTRNEDARSRATAMRALGHCREDLRAMSYLLRALDDEDAWVRYFACQSLGRLGFVPAAEGIARLLEDRAGQVRVAAVEALSHLDSNLAQGLLIEAARGEDADVRRAALLGLGIAKRADALPILLEALASREPATRLVAVSALAGFLEPEVRDALGAAAADPDESVRTAAIGFLAARHTAEATAKLIELLPDERTREQILAALSTFSLGRIEGLSVGLVSADDEIAPLLASALARMRHREATEALVRSLSEAGVPGRKAVATTLSGIGTRDVRERLARQSEDDPDPEVRRICALGTTT